MVINSKKEKISLTTKRLLYEPNVQILARRLLKVSLDSFFSGCNRGFLLLLLLNCNVYTPNIVSQIYAGSGLPHQTSRSKCVLLPLLNIHTGVVT